MTMTEQRPIFSFLYLFIFCPALPSRIREALIVLDLRILGLFPPLSSTGLTEFSALSSFLQEGFSPPKEEVVCYFLILISTSESSAFLTLLLGPLSVSRWPPLLVEWLHHFKGLGIRSLPNLVGIRAGSFWFPSGPYLDY